MGRVRLLVSSRSADWFEQAKRDVETARILRGEGRYEWAAFVSQQAAEKAIKAVLQAKGRAAWGHAVTDLLQALAAEAKIEVPTYLGPCAMRLDRNYIGARYPDSWAEGPPHRYYTEVDADDAIGCAEKILRFCHDLLV